MKRLNNIWKDQTSFIIGGGPSLIGFDFTPIIHRNVIGVNNAYLLGDWVDICWFGDLKWHQWHHEQLKSFKGIIAHCNTKSSLINLKRLIPFERNRVSGIDTTPNSVAWNRCSGFSAINFAYHLGSRKIVLLGFDMNHNGKQRNWHNDHKEKCTLREADTRYSHYLTCCPVIQKDANRLGVRIINTNLNSAIEVFEKLSLEKVLEEETTHV